ncbi:MAG: hypothetical protein M3P18_07175 [Actinomycetota bacterium]|nr:hypothetical protein [Actinomycetota bacterium]
MSLSGTCREGRKPVTQSRSTAPIGGWAEAVEPEAGLLAGADPIGFVDAMTDWAGENG